MATAPTANAIAKHSGSARFKQLMRVLLLLYMYESIGAERHGA